MQGLQSRAYHLRASIPSVQRTSVSVCGSRALLTVSPSQLSGPSTSLSPRHPGTNHSQTSKQLQAGSQGLPQSLVLGQRSGL